MKKHDGVRVRFAVGQLWCPDDASCELLDLPGSPDQRMANRSYTKRYNIAQVEEESQISGTEGARLDRSYRIYPGGFTTQFHELEYFVRSEDGLAAVEARTGPDPHQTTRAEIPCGGPLGES